MHCSLDLEVPIVVQVLIEDTGEDIETAVGDKRLVVHTSKIEFLVMKGKYFQ